MSQINTNGIDVNYPVPGQNNSSQGFRDNFAQIRTNLNIASGEITDLQNKAVLKSALANTTLNNDMANTLISNAAIRSFRHTTYNLGNAISGTVLIDVSRADVQYGSVVGNTTFQFGGWAPTNTENSLTLRLTFANSSAVVSLPSECVSSNNNFGVTLLENYADANGIPTFTAPANANVVEFDLSTLDCGNTISLMPTNRGFKSTQIVERDVPPTGEQGDTTGTIAVGPSVTQLEIASTNASDYFTTTDTDQLFPEMPIVFTGTSMEANVTIGTTYYVRNVVSNTTFTVSSTVGGANVDLAGNASPTSQMFANPVTYLYVCVDDFDSDVYNKNATNSNVSGNITLDTTTSLTENSPIVFTGDVDTANTNLLANTVYYIKTTDGNSPGNITISRTRVNGVAGGAVSLGTGNLTAVATCYVGKDIWRRINLNSW
jgi:hypothetical protein